MCYYSGIFKNIVPLNILPREIMYLGPCPICYGKLHIYKSLDLDNFERWDYDCKSSNCMIKNMEWNYDKKDDLIKWYTKSMDMQKYPPKSMDRTHNKIYNKPEQQVKVHYSKSKKLKDVKCSSGKSAKKCTNDLKLVNCYHCTFTAGYKSAKG